MGDSITDSWGRHHGKFFPGEPYINRGIGGQTTSQMLLRFRRDVIALQPKVVVILGGTNDFKPSLGPIPPEETRNNIMSMVDLARANNIQVVLSSLTPVMRLLHPSDQDPAPGKALGAERLDEGLRRQEQHRVPGLLARHARRKGISAELTLEGLHPNDAGYAVIEPLAEKAIDAALKQVR